MIAMQYQITLPADYDMGVIRDRVARTGHVLDRYPGLGLKAFLVRERGVDGSPVNQYAPFYLWSDAAGAASFLWSGVGFTAIVRDFGRPVVQTWVGGTSHRAAGGLAGARYAVRTTRRLGDDTDVVVAAAEADAGLRSAVGRPGTLLGAYGVDPRTWELVTFTLHAARPDDPSEDATTFEVLHLSTPEHDRLPTAVSTRLAPPPVVPQSR
ncbi:protein of unknown function [Friedmanniella luteola]|uniref:DUF4865 domain-containing protein n=1 Tax=Friedmanniella luteola TaxID=546871 RepID=A0A1H1UUC1_9ACTN|nr:DUF4865 family protein [Friedmanniella luteola]SDS76142.1 protein of unknown function [Friedmanniella luteola]